MPYMCISIFIIPGKGGHHTDDYIDQTKVFFKCNICEFEFQADPDFIPIKCPQCGSEENYRV